MLKMWEKELSEESKRELIEKVASEIRKRKLQTPAILFLEMHKPFSTIVGNAAIMFSPFLMPFLGFKSIDDYSQLFRDRENIDRIINSLEKAPE